jgi:hypothetical protein
VSHFLGPNLVRRNAARGAGLLALQRQGVIEEVSRAIEPGFLLVS